MINYDDLIDEMKEYVLSTFRKGGEGTTLSGRNAGPHPNTGAFERSITDEKIEMSDGGIKINILGNHYGEYLNRGVRAENIKSPFAPAKIGARSQNGNISIIGDGGLFNWVKTKLKIGDDREALNISYAIARKHKEHGFPIRNNQPPGTLWLEGDETDKQKLDNLANTFNGIIEKEISRLWQSQ